MASDFSTRVLVVDDNEDAAELLSELLNMQGYTTNTAYDGFMALDVAMSFEPHIIVLDLSMPKFSGDEVAPMLRQVDKFKDAYIIALTSHDCSEARALTSRTGFDLHLTKPVNLSELVAALERGAALTGSAARAPRDAALSDRCRPAVPAAS